MLVVLLFSITAWGQNTDDFDPASPIEPNQPVLPDHPVEPEDTATYYVLSLLAQEGGSVKSGGGEYAAGTEVQVVANAAATNFVFTGWTNEKGDTISKTLSFKYTMPAKNTTLLAHYDFLPGSPVEPSKPDIEERPVEPVDTTTYYSLSLVAEEGGSITAGAGKYAAGTDVTVTASAPSTNFVFTGWTDEKGDTISLERSFAYAMPACDKTLTAHYDYNPGSPVEPSEPDIKEKDPDPEPVPTHTLRIKVEEGGTVTVNGTVVNGSSTLEIAEGATTTIATTLSTNFTFDGWYRLTEEGSELYSSDRSFTFTMDTIDVALVAKFNYEPGAPSEPSMPVTTNSEMYLMSVVGLPGETINYPLYINTNDTLRDISFEMQFPVKIKPDFDNAAISPNAVGYTFTYELLGSTSNARQRAEVQDDGNEQFANYLIKFTGGHIPPGNTALLVVPVTIDEDIELERHRIWLSQVQVMQNDSTVVGATTRNGAINTNYEEPDSYAYLDNLIKVGSSVYSTTQSQQISRLEPFTVNVPADSIAYVLGCSDVSFVTFKGRENLLKITDEETAEHGFWFGTDGYVRQYVANADSMRMAVQYDPVTHVMSIMQYPGAYKVGDADTVKVYFTYKYKYYEVELQLNISAQIKDVEVAITESGTLEETIADPTILETLAIAGPLNGTDIRFIRQEVPNLKTLDLSKAWIVEGGEAYIDDLHTTNLTIGERMFAELPALESLILCDSIRAIGVKILSNSLQVSTIAIPAMTETVAEGALDDSRKDIKVVWNAVNATVPALLNGNPNLMIYAVGGVKGEKEWQNIIHDGRMASLTLRDDYPLYIPESFLANEVTYARKFTKTANPKDASGWESIVLPFEVKTVKHRVSGRVLAPFGSEEECDAHFWLGQMTGDGFGKATSIIANTPYLIRMPNSEEYAEEDNVTGVITFTATDNDGVMMHSTHDVTTISGNGYMFVPAYETVSASESVFAINDTDYEGYLPGSIFVRMQRDVRPMEAYIIAKDGPARERGYIAIESHETDGIEEITLTKTTTDKVFTLTGMRINAANMKKGNIYIINGKQRKY